MFTLTAHKHTMNDSLLIRKKTVWQALSTFYLDADLGDDEFEAIFQHLVSSGFSLEELEAIHLNEVAPVLQSNLRSVAGEWTGFDPEWLSVSIVKWLNRPVWYRQFINMLFRSSRKSLTTTYWERVVARREELKGK